MNLVRGKLFLLVMITAAVCMLAEDAKAGGWPVRRKKFIVAVSANYFTANTIWDRDRKVQNYSNKGKFTSTGLFLSAEYGISRRWTAVASLPMLANSFKDTLTTLNSTGLGDAELGARYYLFNVDLRYYFGLQGTLVLPLYRNTATTNLGYQNVGADLKLAGSTSVKIDSLRGLYFNLEAGVRQYFSSTGPFQIRVSGSTSYSLDPKNQLSFGATAIKSISADKSFSNINLAQIKNFSYLQVSLSYGYTFSRRLSAFGGINQSVIGQNTGIGTNLFVSVATKF